MEIEKLSLEDKVYVYLQEIYGMLNDIYEYVKNNKDDDFYRFRYLKTGIDGFESATIYFEDIYFKLADRYTNKMYFTYMDEVGEIFLPPSLDGMFYGSRINLYESVKQGNKLSRCKVKSEIGVKAMLADDIVRYLESVYNKLLKYRTISLENQKVKVK